MRDLSFGPALTTLALAAGAAAPCALADEACGDADCEAPARANHGARNVDGFSQWVEESEGTEAAAVSAAQRPYELMGDAELTRTSQSAAPGPYRGPRIPVRTAYATPLVASNDTCMGSRTFGLQAVSFGFSFGTTWSDRQCRRVKNARALEALGYHGAALALLCQDRQVRRAMDRAGTPCPGRGASREVAHVPNTPQQPEPVAEPPPLITFDNVLFDFDRATLRPEANHILEPLLAMLQADPGMAIDIEGHTDWIGSDAYNEGLSQRRAQAVVEWLVAHGIARERISAVGRGESEPIATNANAEGRQLNRRVEIRRRTS